MAKIAGQYNTETGGIRYRQHMGRYDSSVEVYNTYTGVMMTLNLNLSYFEPCTPVGLVVVDIHKMLYRSKVNIKTRSSITRAA